jgi:hypothetical protein
VKEREGVTECAVTPSIVRSNQSGVIPVLGIQQDIP